MIDSNVFKIGISVISNSKYSKGMVGSIHKVSNEKVHVRFNDGTFEVFHFNPTHHMQTNISQLEVYKNGTR